MKFIMHLYIVFLIIIFCKLEYCLIVLHFNVKYARASVFINRMKSRMFFFLIKVSKLYKYNLYKSDSLLINTIRFLNHYIIQLTCNKMFCLLLVNVNYGYFCFHLFILFK